ncbi:MAG: hypothetical protein OEL85_09690, partial [Desulfobulbaceae bacterium]|nr:hypothetical protein [Desulfobulbaceae bacterium]
EEGCEEGQEGSQKGFQGFLGLSSDRTTLCAKPLLFYNNYDMYRILLLLAVSTPVFTVVTGLQEQYLP